MTVIKLALLRHTKAKDGSFKIRIAIGHHSETHYIVTPYAVNSPSEFVNGSVVRLPNAAQMNLELTQLLLDYQQRLKRIPNPDQYTCGQLRKILQSMTTVTADTTFNTVAAQYIAQLRQDGQTSYADMLERNVKHFTDFAFGDIFLSTITPQRILDFERYLRRRTFIYNGEAKHLSDTSINMYMSNVRTIINRAIKMQMVRYDMHPFMLWHKKADPERELDISVDDLRKIRDYEPPKYRTRVARDLFMLSYYLGGINLVDLLAYDFRKKTTMEYVRHKSRNTKQGDKRISLTIQPEALAIIQKYIDQKNGRLSFNIDLEYSILQNKINHHLKIIAKAVGIQDYQKVCWYTARKSFVQHGFDLGITLEVLEYCIGQSVKRNRPIFNYLKIMRKHADDAIRTILDNLADPVTTHPTE